jgi:membrane protease YdiL (CAAX protease family)
LKDVGVRVPLLALPSMPDAAIESPTEAVAPRRPRSLSGMVFRPLGGILVWGLVALFGGMLPAPFGALGGLLVGVVFVRRYRLWGRNKNLRTLAQVRLRPLTKQRIWMTGVLLAFLVYEFGYVLLAMRLGASDPPSKTSVIATTSLVCTCLVVPFIEEFWFRGWMLRSLEWRLGKRRAVLLTAFLFGTLHFQLSAIPHLIVLGIVTAAVLYQTGSLWAAILIHAANNALAFGLPRVVDGRFIVGLTTPPFILAVLAVGLGGLTLTYVTRGPRLAAVVG